MTAHARTWAIYAGIMLAALLAPVLVYLSAGMRPDYDGVLLHYQVALALGAAGIVALEIHRSRSSTARLTVLLGGVLLLMTTHSVMWRFIKPTFDFQVYQKAAQAIAEGTNPYVHGKAGYLYPPFLAETVYLLDAAVDPVEKRLDALAREHEQRAAQEAGKKRRHGEQAKLRLPPVYSLWCGLQLLAALLVYAVGYRLARRLGADALLATALPLGLLLANPAYWRTLENGQVNLFLTASLLVAILAAARRPLLSGLCVALGAHLKIYSAFLLGAWSLTGRWKVAAYAVLCFGLVVTIQLAIFDAALWQQYFALVREAPQQVRADSLATVSFISRIFGDGRPIHFEKQPWSFAAWFTAASYAAILLLMGWRFLQRERLWRRFAGELTAASASGDVVKCSISHREAERSPRRSSWEIEHLPTSPLALAAEERFRIMGHANDAVVLPLLLSPIVWNHHYLVLLPGLIWSVVLLGPARLRSWLPVALVLVPDFGHPFTSLCYAGVWLWLYQSAPRAIWRALTTVPWKPGFA